MDNTMPNPVMQQGQCVVNCAVDTFFIHYRKSRKSYGKGDNEYLYNNSGDNESFYVVMPREYAFRIPMSVDASIGRSNVVSSNQIIPKIFTSLNNFPTMCTRDNHLFRSLKKILESHHVKGLTEKSRNVIGRLLREMVARSIIFVGVPLTRVNPAENMSSSISLTVSGTVTVYNTGSHTIESGQKVAWDIPDVIDPALNHIRGEPRGKIFVEIVPVLDNGPDSNLRMDPQEVSNALRELDGLNVDFKYSYFTNSSFYKDFFKVFESGHLHGDTTTWASAINMTSGITSRVIGTALTTCSRGGSFDLLLQI